jgi:hypothetical protein
MRMTRGCVLALVTLTVAGAAGTGVHAQQPGAAAMFVPVSGTADAGSPFTGTFFIRRFDARPADNAILAVGSIDAVLNGRTLVTQIAIPLTIAPGTTAQTAGLTAATPTRCDAVRVDLAPAALRALGSVLTLDPTSFDIIASEGTAPAVVTGVAPGGSALGAGSPSAAAPGLATPTSSTTGVLGQTGTTVPTAPSGSVTPGVIMPPAPPLSTPAATAPSQPLGQLLCSVSTLAQSVSIPTQLVPMMNQVLLALSQ